MWRRFDVPIKRDETVTFIDGTDNGNPKQEVHQRNEPRIENYSRTLVPCRCIHLVRVGNSVASPATSGSGLMTELH